MEVLASAGIAVAVVVVLFLIFRAFVLWYWKVDEQISLLKEIRDSIRASRQIGTTQATSGPGESPMRAVTATTTQCPDCHALNPVGAERCHACKRFLR